VCGQRAGYGRTSVQDHVTKGDQPFQALVTRQIEVQPPSRQPYSDFAPLRGRKVRCLCSLTRVRQQLDWHRTCRRTPSATSCGPFFSVGGGNSMQYR
jgi:hypothetical protein